MVGVATSKRCDNCRKRKKKCDEQRPSCSECIRGGWTCPGYPANWKFVDETARLTEHYVGRKYVYDVVDVTLEEEYSRCVNEDEEANQAMMTKMKGFHLLCNSHSFDQGPFSVPSNVPRYHNPNPLGSNLAFCLESKVKGRLIPLRFIGSFFEFIPARLGCNAALDDAVSCICAIYGDNLSASNKLDKEIYRSYVKALCSLRSCLSDTALRMEPETLCASGLLQACELVVNADTGEWSHLARGTAYLMYSRGVHRYRTAFEHAMLESQLSYIFGQSMRLKEHCFLEKLEWQELISKTSIWPYQRHQARSLSLKSHLCGNLAHIPGLIVDYSALGTMPKSLPEREERLNHLLHRTIELYRNIEQWLAIYAGQLFQSHTSPNQGCEREIQYQDLISAVLDSVANMALITIGRIIQCLYNTTLISNQLRAQEYQQGFDLGYLEDNMDTTERRRQRAMAAFNAVREESEFAAKPLEFGLRQIQGVGFAISTRK